MSARCPDDSRLAAFLGHPGADPEVAAHLASCAPCRRIVETLAREGAISRSDATATVEATTTEIGSTQLSPVLPASAGALRFGRYAVLRELGRGAMGTVYAARDPELDRLVAIKVLRAEPESGSQARLQREARAMARVVHPNVVVVHDVGALEDGRVFVAMEHVVGRTLRNVLDDPSVSTPSRIRLILAAGEGLAAAHAAGIVHRDFKPANILVGDDGRVKVSDFGLARVHAATVDATTAGPLTRPGAVVGTPAYMAPEQFAGLTADEKSDQFAFAVCVWEVLSGRRPFPGRSYAEIEAAVVDGRISTELDGRVPPGITGALRRALSRSPAARFASMRELLDVLVREGIADVDPSPRGPATAPLQRPLAPQPRAVTPTPAPPPALPPGGSAPPAYGARVWGARSPAPPPRSSSATIAAAIASIVAVAGLATCWTVRQAVGPLGGGTGATSAPGSCRIPAPERARFDDLRTRMTQAGGAAVGEHAVRLLTQAEENIRDARQSLCENQAPKDRAVHDARRRCLTALHAQSLALLEGFSSRGVTAPYEALTRIGRLPDVGACTQSDDVVVAFSSGVDETQLTGLGRLQAALLLGDDVEAAGKELLAKTDADTAPGARAETLLVMAQGTGAIASLREAELLASGMPSIRTRARALRAGLEGSRLTDDLYTDVDTRARDVLVVETARGLYAGRAGDRARSWLSTWGDGPSAAPSVAATGGAARVILPAPRSSSLIPEATRRLEEKTSRSFGAEHPTALVLTSALAEVERRSGDTAAAVARIETASALADARLAKLASVPCGPARPSHTLDPARDRESFEAARVRLRAAHAALGEPEAANAEVEAIAAAVARCPSVLLDARAALIHAADALGLRAPAVAGAARKRLAELEPPQP